MPRVSPRNPTRSFHTRVNGIFKKSSELHGIDGQTKIAIFVEKPGLTPLVFTVEEHDLSFPCGIQEFISTRHPVIKRPSHYLSLSEGISKGKAQIVEPSPPPPYTVPPRQDLLDVNEKTQEFSQPSETAGSTGSSPYHIQGSPYSFFEMDWPGLATPPQYLRSISPHVGLGTLPSKRPSIG